MQRSDAPRMSAVVMWTGVMLLGATADAIVPNATTGVTFQRTEDGGADLEILGDGARTIYRSLVSGHCAHRTNTTSYGRHELVIGRDVTCETPAFAGDVAIYRCWVALDHRGDLLRRPGGEDGPGSGEGVVDAGPATVTRRSGRTSVVFQGSPARSVHQYIRAQASSEMGNERGRDVECSWVEFPTDIPRMLFACGFSIDASGAALPLGAAR